MSSPAIDKNPQTRIASRPLLIAACLAAALSFAPKLRVCNADDEDVIEEANQTEQGLAEKVDVYNKLLKQSRFNEAVVLAKETQLLWPENPVTEAMLYKAKFAKQDAFNRLTAITATLAAHLPREP